MFLLHRERKRREQEKKLGQIRSNPVMAAPPPHHQPPPAQPYHPPQHQPPVPSRPEKLATLPRNVGPPPGQAAGPNPGNVLFKLQLRFLNLYSLSFQTTLRNVSAKKNQSLTLKGHCVMFK